MSHHGQSTAQAELIARALSAQEKARNRDEYYSATEVLQDLHKLLQKAAIKHNK